MNCSRRPVLDDININTDGSGDKNDAPNATLGDRLRWL